MPARPSPFATRLRPLAGALALLAIVPAVARAQASSSVAVRATVVATRAPRLDVSLVAAPSATPAVAAVGRASSERRDGAVEVTTAVRVTGNAGYRLLVRARPGAAAHALAVRDASGVFRPLSSGAAVEVARGTGQEGARSIVYRASGDASAAELPVVYELVYDPVA